MTPQVAYQVKLEVFEGPLDLLFHLIQKHEIDLYDIPISHILDQYMQYVRIMEMLDIDFAGEFLVMASTLMWIKSKMLLPVHQEDDPEEDPRESLVQQLLEYKRFKEAAGQLAQQQEAQDVFFPRGQDEKVNLGPQELIYQVSLFDLVNAFAQILKQVDAQIFPLEIVQPTEEIHVEERIGDLIELLKQRERLSFEDIFGQSRSKPFLIATFLAILELVRLKEIEAIQEKSYGPIWVQAHCLDKTKIS